jgi:eukaryotic-like serine/threonine-protein kinase
MSSVGLKQGDKLGPYEIVSAIGKGGMGEVWKARDPRLGREVAIKVSAQQFSDRFEREARAIAALNHPNICTLYDVGPNYLVMELIEGPTLADRIAQGPLPLEEALRVAQQIADALEAAHEKGITHRDLKPANVKIKPDGKIKVLDFGLAKSAEASEVTPDSPTMLSTAGMILGTAGYMSPEQARGKQEVDKRADIWAFGVVLYEMLTGKRLFQGEDVGHTLALVIMQEPDLSAAPPEVVPLLKRCLEKDPKSRLRDIGDAMPLLQVNVGPAATSRGRLAWMVVAGVMTVVSVALLLAFLYLRPKPPASPLVRFEVAAPDRSGLVNPTAQEGAAINAISPDGTRLLFFGSSAGGKSQLWMRRLDSLEAHALEGTDGATDFPFWSPDSRFVVFGTQEGKLKKIDTAGGPAIPLCDAPRFFGGFFTADGKIAFSSSELQEVPAGGGAVSHVDTAPSRNAFFPTPLPDGRHFVFLGIDPAARSEGDAIFLGSLDVKPDVKPGMPSAKKLLAVGSPTTGPHEVAFVASPVDPDHGYILYVRQTGRDDTGTLTAQPFDVRKLELEGEAIPIASEQVHVEGFSVSRTGVLAWRSGFGLGDTALTLFDSQGKALAKLGEPGRYLTSMAFSPDGTRVVAARIDSSPGSSSLWMFDLTRGFSTRFTPNPGQNTYPVWSPDGSRVVFASNGAGLSNDLYQKLSNGGGEDELLLPGEGSKFPLSWSQDGRFLLYSKFLSDRVVEFWVLPLDSSAHPAGKPFPFVRNGIRRDARFSPGRAGPPRWIAYASQESGRNEIYLRSFDPSSPTGSPANAGEWAVSRDGGVGPRWSGDGRQLFYLAPDRTVMVVDVTGNPASPTGIPRALFKPNGLQPRRPDLSFWDVSPDGKKFLFPIPVAANTAAVPFTVVLNWTSLLKK